MLGISSKLNITTLLRKNMISFLQRDSVTLRMQSQSLIVSQSGGGVMMTMMVAFRRRYITFLSRLEAKHGVHSLSIKVRKE